MSGLSLRLFGVLQLERDDGRVIRLPTKKTAALLAYLALSQNQPHARAKLATLLWDRGLEVQARDSLRQVLSQLRKAFAPDFEDCLATTGDTVELNLRRIPLDTARFEAFAAGTQISDLEQAAKLYRGPILEGFDVRAAEFDAWLRATREQYHERAVDVLSRLLRHYLAVGNLESGITIATRLLALDPLREEVHRTLIEFYIRQGRFNAALKQFRSCEEILAEQLNVEPEAATKAMERRIREMRDNPEQRTGMDAASAGVRPSFAPLALERKQITVLSCGLVGFGALAAQLDPEEVHALAAAYRRRCNEIVAPYGGVTGALAGDDLTVCFGALEANEHSAEQAVRAALALIEDLPHLGADFAPAMSVRIGIATSAVVIGQFAEENEPPSPALLGDAPRWAVLLQNAAAPGGIVIAEATYALVGNLFECRRLPTPIDGDVDAWLITGESSAQSRFEAIRASKLTPFTGRRAELEYLLCGWRAARGGSGRTILIAGDAGIGKSRLTRMCHERIGVDAQGTLLFQCSPFHAESPLYPFIRHLEQAAGFVPEDTPGQKLGKLETMLSGSAWRAAGLVRLIAELLSVPVSDRYPHHGLSPLQQRRRTLAALLDWIESTSRQKPLLVVFEDAHWADASSLELLDLLIERVAHLPILLLVTTRPGATLPWDCLDHVYKLALAGLEEHEAGLMVRRISGDGNLPPEVLGQIAARANGVPLFVEELTRATLEAAGVQTNPALASSGPLSVIPTSLQDSLSSRLDRLGPAKPVSQTAAVIGREFTSALLAAVLGVCEEEVRPAIGTLIEFRARAEADRNRARGPQVQTRAGAGGRISEPAQESPAADPCLGGTVDQGAVSRRGRQPPGSARIPFFRSWNGARSAGRLAHRGPARRRAVGQCGGQCASRQGARPDRPGELPALPGAQPVGAAVPDDGWPVGDGDPRLRGDGGPADFRTRS